MNISIMTHDTAPDQAVVQAAQELVERYGRGAVTSASERAQALAQQSRWPEHDAAMRVLTMVERLLEGKAG